jgi:hypothetical protein
MTTWRASFTISGLSVIAVSFRADFWRVALVL